MTDFGTHAETSKYVARKFVQTVVVIDDEAAFGSTPSKDREPDMELDAQELTRSFSEEGVLCSVIKPEEGVAVTSVVCVARRSDIVIFDWELYHDGGQTTLGLIQDILNDDEKDVEYVGNVSRHGRLRLLVVYTATREVYKIVDRIREGIPYFRAELEPEENRNFIEHNLARIVVLAKKPLMHMPGSYNESVYVPLSDLPKRLIDEFGMMTTGLISNVALDALATIRSEAYGILRQFTSDVDSAYLWHRLNQPNPDDAENHLVSLVTSEIRSVLEDSEVGQWANHKNVTLWVRENMSGDIAPRFGLASEFSVDSLLEVMGEGLAAPWIDNGHPKKDDHGKVFTLSDKYKGSGIGKLHEKVEMHQAFAKDLDSATRAHQKFSILMSLKTRYTLPTPFLSLGTIVRCDDKYWVCVQPQCDSVRLNTPTAFFPLLPLHPVPSTERPKEAIYLIVKEDARVFSVGIKPTEIVMEEFECAADTIIAQKDEEETWIFRATDGKSYQWMGDLKDDLAQSVAHEIGHQFSRVGVSSSEWLRRMDKHKVSQKGS